MPDSTTFELIAEWYSTLDEEIQDQVVALVLSSSICALVYLGVPLFFLISRRKERRLAPLFRARNFSVLAIFRFSEFLERKFEGCKSRARESRLKADDLVTDADDLVTDADDLVTDAIDADGRVALDEVNERKYEKLRSRADDRYTSADQDERWAGWIRSVRSFFTRWWEELSTKGVLGTECLDDKVVLCSVVLSRDVMRLSNWAGGHIKLRRKEIPRPQTDGEIRTPSAFGWALLLIALSTAMLYAAVIDVASPGKMTDGQSFFVLILLLGPPVFWRVVVRHISYYRVTIVTPAGRALVLLPPEQVPRLDSWYDGNDDDSDEVWGRIFGECESTDEEWEEEVDEEDRFGDHGYVVSLDARQERSGDLEDEDSET